MLSQNVKSASPLYESCRRNIMPSYKLDKSNNAYLRLESVGFLGWVVLAVTAHVSTTDFLDGHVLDVEANVVTGKGLIEGGVVHLDRLDFSGEIGGGECDDHARLEGSSLDTTDGHRSNTLKRKCFIRAKSFKAPCAY